VLDQKISVSAAVPGEMHDLRLVVREGLADISEAHRQAGRLEPETVPVPPEPQQLTDLPQFLGRPEQVEVLWARGQVEDRLHIGYHGERPRPDRDAQAVLLNQAAGHATLIP